MTGPPRKYTRHIDTCDVATNALGLKFDVYVTTIGLNVKSEDNWKWNTATCRSSQRSRNNVGWRKLVKRFKKLFEERKAAKWKRRFSRIHFYSVAPWDFQEQWPHWWWQTSCNTILDHMPSENYPPALIVIQRSVCVRTTLRPIMKRNNIIEQQRRPWPETLQLDTNVQICRVIELHNGTEALEGRRGHGFLPIEFF